MNKMKIIIVATVFALSSNLALANEDQDEDKKTAEPMFSADIGFWHINWQQTSTSAETLLATSDRINTVYNIEPALAAKLKLSFNYKFISSSTEYFNSDGASGLGVNISLLELVPFVNFELRYLKANFKGKLDAVRQSDSERSSAEFESPLEIIDIIVYPFNKTLGIGYRNYQYEVPQDVYLVNNSTGSLVTAAGVRNMGLVDVSYEGHFVTLILDNKKDVLAQKNYSGFVYSVIVGYGQLKPKTAGFDRWMAASDATFHDIEIGYSFNKQTAGRFGYGIDFGYRYSKIETTANQAKNSDNYSLMTEFNTEFKGPFVDIRVSF